MKKLPLIILSLLLAAVAAIAGDGKSNLREEISFAADGQDEANILKTAKRIYAIRSKDYACFWGGKKSNHREKRNFSNFSPKK